MGGGVLYSAAAAAAAAVGRQTVVGVARGGGTPRVRLQRCNVVRFDRSAKVAPNHQTTTTLADWHRSLHRHPGHGIPPKRLNQESR